MEPDRQSLLPWLRQLSRLELVQLTPRTVIDVERVLALPLAEDPEALGVALASLLAHDQASWRQIEESFRRWRGAARPAQAVATTIEAASEPATPGAGMATPLAEPSEPPWLRRLFDGLRPRTGFDGLGWRHWVGMLSVLAVVLVCSPLGTVAVIEQTVETPTPTVDRSLEGGSERVLPFDERPETNPKVVIEPVEAPREIREADRSEVTRVPAPTPGPPWALASLVLASLVLAGLAARGWASIAVYRKDLESIERTAHEHRREALQAAKRAGEPYHVGVVSPLSPHAIEDAATVLGRLSRAHPGWELDVPPTIARTIDAGGRVQPMYRAAGHRTGLVVLVDVEGGDHPDLYRVRRVLAQWQRGGLEIHCYDFRFRPAELVPGPLGHSPDLAALAVRHEGAPLLIVSRWALPKDLGGRLPWLGALAAWSNRAWLDCDPRAIDDHVGDARLDRAEIERSGLPRFPFTDKGLLACARTLAASGEHPAPLREEPMPSVRQLEPALRLWAACAWVVPDPVWVQLDAIRRALPELCEALPDAGYVHRLIEWLQDEAVALDRTDRRARARPGQIGQGDRLKVCDQQRRELAAWLRERDEGRLEERARRLVLEQLRAANVEGDPFEAQKRALKIDVHEAVLDPGKAKHLLKDWAHTAMADELRRFLADERWLQRGKGLAIAGKPRWGSGVWEVYEAWESGRAGARLVDVLRRRAWTWERVRAMAIAGVAVLGSYAAWWAVEQAAEVERVVITRGGVVTVPATWEVKRVDVEDKASSTRRRPVCEDHVSLSGVASLRMICIPEGRTLMGSPANETGRDEDEGPQRIASIAQFMLAETEVTQAQWKAVMQTEPFDCRFGCGGEYPAHGVPWNDAVEFMNRLTELESSRLPTEARMTPCYERADGEWVWTNRLCTGYRLPTEAEWEHAARAGTSTSYSFGSRTKDLGEHGWYQTNSGTDAHPVKEKKPNPWGLYDVHGNVWEWVWDYYDPRYPTKGIPEGYSGPRDGTHRVIRGGSFGNTPRSLRSADRFRKVPTHTNVGIGFRCARAVSGVGAAAR